MTEFLLRSNRAVLEFAGELGLTETEACNQLKKRFGRDRGAGLLEELLELELLARDLHAFSAGIECRRHEVRLKLHWQLLGLPENDLPAGPRTGTVPSAGLGR